MATKPERLKPQMMRECGGIFVPLDVPKAAKDVTVNLTVKLKGMWRMRLGLWIVKLGIRIAGCGVKVNEQ